MEGLAVLAAEAVSARARVAEDPLMQFVGFDVDPLEAWIEARCQAAEVKHGLSAELLRDGTFDVERALANVWMHGLLAGLHAARLAEEQSADELADERDGDADERQAREDRARERADDVRGA